MRAARLLMFSVLVSTPSMVAAQTSGPPNAAASRQTSGSYVGLETMHSLSPDDPLTHWYHENTLFIRNNEFILDQAPVTIRKGRKTYSASDGGFLVYRGRIFRTDNGTFAAMRLFSSDYVIFRSGPKECEPYSRIIVFPIRITNATISMDGVRYQAKPAPNEYQKIWTKELADESVEYRGKHYIDPHAPACPLPTELISR